MSLKLTYDPDANAAYVRFSNEPILESEEVSSDIILDYDDAGHIVGMEVLDARGKLNSALLASAA